MSSLRHLWFDSRHLLGNPAGQTLLTELDALGTRTRETILLIGDRLAAISLTLAQTFCRVAPAAWRTFGAKEFPRWVAIGERLAGEEPASRDGAAAYFTIDPHSLSLIGLDIAEEWSEIGRGTLQVSRRLGSQFFQSSAPLLVTLPAPIPDRLGAWVKHGCALLRAKGWKGEFLAASYFEAAPAALPVLSSAEMAAWAKLGMLVQDSGPWTFYTTLPTGFAAFSGIERMELLTACHQAASLAPKVVSEVFLHIPVALVPFPVHLRTLLLSLLVPVIRTEPTAILPLLPLLSHFMKTVPLDQDPWLQEQLATLAQRFSAGVPAVIRTLPRVCEETGKQGIADWLTKGLDVAKDNAAAGIAYFALESRSSLRQLRQSSQGVDLDEVQELLRKYIQMLSGTPVGIRKQEMFAYPPPLEEFPFYSDALPLPARVDMLPTYEENFRLFRLVAVQQAGRREFGTYDFSLAELWPQLPPHVRRLLKDDHDPLGGLAEYFRCFPHPDVLEALFVVVETQRVMTHMSRVYRGLQEELHWVTTLELPSLVPDLLLPLVPQLRARGREHNTVYDSALAAAEVYAQLLSAIVAEIGRAHV